MRAAARNFAAASRRRRSGFARLPDPPAMSLIVLALAASLVIIADDSLIGRFLNRDDTALTSYVAWRRLEARNERFKVEGWMEACVSQSSGAFTYRVEREGGSGYIRNK